MHVCIITITCITDGNFITNVIDQNFITDEFFIAHYYMFYKRLLLVFHLGILHMNICITDVNMFFSLPIILILVIYFHLYCRWVLEFLSEDNQGLDVLVDYLSYTQVVMR